MSEEEKKSRTPIIDLKPGQEDVTIKGRVLEAGPARVIQTRKGPRTISDAVIGDETGRVKVTAWGSKAGTIEEGKVLEISGAWTTAYRGQVQVNIGRNSEVKELGDEEAPRAEDIPEESPTAPQEYRRPPRRGGYYRTY